MSCSRRVSMLLCPKPHAAVFGCSAGASVLHSAFVSTLQENSDATPTRARYGVLAFLCSLSFVLYIDRACIGKAAVAIRHDLELTEAQLGYALAAFTLAYGLFEVPTGRWGDRFGSRGVLARIVVWWSVFTALTGAAMGLWTTPRCRQPPQPEPER